MMATIKEKVYLEVIQELVKERDKWEFLYKHPLPKGWIRAEEHPRIGELTAVIPDILLNQ
jgi:hypothetical protein